jgi:hypothetical protein
MFFGADSRLVHLVRPYPHALSLLEELEVVLIQEEN